MSRADCLKYIDKSKKYLTADFKSDSYLNDLLTVACLLVEDGLNLSYSHRSFQEFFVAKFILNAHPDVQVSLLNKFFKNVDTDNVVGLLYEMDPDLVERAFFIPKMEEMMNKIGLKDRVGITHMTKLIKFFAQSIRYSNVSKTFGILFDSEKSNKNYIQQYLFVIRFCAKLLPEKEKITPSPSELKKFESMQLDYPEDIEMESVSYRSKIIRDLYNLNSFWLFNNFLDAYEAYKKMIIKHQNVQASLDELLS